MGESLQYALADLLTQLKNRQGITIMAATWYKMKDDSWGVRIKGAQGEANQQVEVVKKSGETKIVILGKLVAKFDDAELWSVAPAGTVNVSTTKPLAAKPAPAQLPDEEPF